MDQELKKPTAATLTVIGVVARLIPHLPNMTPIGATALFGGAQLKKPWSYTLPLLTMFISDIFLGFHNTMLYVYGSFALTVFIGEMFLKKNPTVAKAALLGVVSSLVFFLITNFGVWEVGGLYPKTMSGLVESYVMGLPFLRNMMIGDVLYSAGIFALYSWAVNRGVVDKFDKTILGWITFQQ